MSGQRKVHYLLVIDPSSEPAAHINSLLRNSGISIHVLHANNGLETRRLLREFKPLAVIYHPVSEATFPVAEAALLANELETLFAVRTTPAQAGALTEAMRHGPALGLDLNDDQKLLKLTTRLLNNALAAQQHHLAQKSEDEVAARLSLLLETTEEAVAYLHEGLHTAANTRYLNLLGLESFPELEGVSLLEILSSENQDLKQLLRELSNGHFPEKPMHFNALSKNKDSVQVSARFFPTVLDGEPCIQMLLKPSVQALPKTKTEHDTPPQSHPMTAVAPREANAQAGDRDPLTGLLRRQVFMQGLEQRIDQIPDHQRAALFYLQASDTESALAEASVALMDQYTSMLARVISHHLDSDSLACRFGDYSFALLTLRSGKSRLEAFADDLYTSAVKLVEEEPELTLPAKYSVGFAMLDSHTHHAETAVSQAREAWRQAVADGFHTLRFKPVRGLGLDANEETQWAQRLRYALDNEDFYTAQYDVTNLEGEAEGLVENRTFLQEDNEEVPFEEFQAVADQVGMASSIDRYIIPHLFHALSNSKQRHIINISSSSLQDFSFASWLRREMNNSGVDSTHLILQWPAAAACDHPKAARRLIEELQPSGCKFSLSGMDGEQKHRALISEFEPDFIRLHAQLTRGLQDRPDAAELIRKLVRDARSVNALSIASDVGDSTDLATLWQCGVKLVAGDFLQEAPRVIGA